MIKIYLPWSLPGTFNGFHPLPASLLDVNEPDIQFVAPVKTPDSATALRTVEAFTEFTAKLMAQFRGHPVVTPEHILEFAKSRNIQAQLLRPADADVTFLHSVPDTIGTSPWIIHIGSPQNLFHPYLWQGQTAGLKLRSQHAYWLVRYLLEQPECLAVFTHLRQTEQALGTLFESQIIAGKTHYIPLGVKFSPAEEAQIRAASAGRESDDVVMLFTNSFHQHPENFVIRGGVDVVTAFVIASKYAPNLRLILCSSLHEIIGADLEHFLRSHPRVTLIESKLGDEELHALHCQADILLIPSARAHCLSVARAMHYGLVCIASDAPGYEELISDQVTGFLLPGRRSAICEVETETGWLRDDYLPMFNPDSRVATELATLMIKLAQRDTLRRQIGSNAQSWARRNMKYVDWTGGFARLIRQLPLLAWSIQAARQESNDYPETRRLRAMSGR
jgi:glycosyltransferase involved in cell wall biosynthesis